MKNRPMICRLYKLKDISRDFGGKQTRAAHIPRFDTVVFRDFYVIYRHTFVEQRVTACSRVQRTIVINFYFYFIHLLVAGREYSS